MTSRVIVVGADKGGVGKTTVARTVLDYLGTKAITARAFDTEAPKGVLARFHPENTTIVDLNAGSDGYMTIFDNLGAAPVTLIDVRAGLLTPALETLQNIGLLDAVKSNRIELTLLHILGASMASFSEVDQMDAFMAGAKHVLVKNHINNASFFAWDPDVAKELTKGNPIIEIPKLDEGAAERVEASGLPFTTYLANKSSSMVLRGYTSSWLKKVYAEYDRVLGF